MDRDEFLELSLDDRRRSLIKALRSGEFTEGVGQLVRLQSMEVKPEFCCMGVGLCVSRGSDVLNAIVDTETPSEIYDELNDQYVVMYGESFTDDGYDIFQGDYCVEHRTLLYLSRLNDGREGKPGKSFKFIARFLEIIWGLSDSNG